MEVDDEGNPDVVCWAHQDSLAARLGQRDAREIRILNLEYGRRSFRERFLMVMALVSVGVLILALLAPVHQ